MATPGGEGDAMTLTPVLFHLKPETSKTRKEVKTNTGRERKVKTQLLSLHVGTNLKHSILPQGGKVLAQRSRSCQRPETGGGKWVVPQAALRPWLLDVVQVGNEAAVALRLLRHGGGPPEKKKRRLAKVSSKVCPEASCEV